MSIPADDKASLHDLELDVRMELVLAETSEAEPEGDGAPAAEAFLEPDVERYEVALRTLLGAIEAVEDSPRPGDDPRSRWR